MKWKDFNKIVKEAREEMRLMSVYTGIDHAIIIIVDEGMDRLECFPQNINLVTGNAFVRSCKTGKHKQVDLKPLIKKYEKPAVEK